MSVKQRYGGLRNDYEAATAQAALKKKYGIKDSNTVVVERSTAAAVLRVIWQIFYLIISLLARIAIIALAVIGLATLIFPSTRAAFTYQLDLAVTQLFAYL